MDSDLSNEELAALQRAQPSWRIDGLGMKGDSTPISNTKANLVWDSQVTFRRPELRAETT